ncbi:hypothetical protein ACHAWX_006762 [Stephanocyclus meneghinianus]
MLHLKLYPLNAVITLVNVSVLVHENTSLIITPLMHPNAMSPTRKRSNCKRQLSTTSCASASSMLPVDDPRLEPRSIHKLSIPLPLGLTLEEMDLSDPSYGVTIIGMTTDGNAAQLNANVFSDITKYDPSTVGEQCICIRDKIISVNGISCQDKSLEVVIEAITTSKSTEITLEVGRVQGSTVLCFSNGVCVSSKPGESYGFLAKKCGIDIEYQCRTGNCFTCQRWMKFPDRINSGKEAERNVYQRTILNCVGTVPRGYHWIFMLDDGNDVCKTSDASVALF